MVTAIQDEEKKLNYKNEEDIAGVLKTKISHTDSFKKSCRRISY